MSTLTKLCTKFFIKEADLVFNRYADENSPYTAYGLYAGLPGDMDDEKMGPASQAATKRLQALLRAEGSVQRAKAAYLKENPNHFVTAAFLQEGAPRQGLMGRFKGLFGAKDPIHESALKSYNERMRSPRAFVRSGGIGGYHQDAFYNEVERGLYDDELNQIHIPKKDRIIYT